MKVAQHHVEAMRSSIQPLDTAERRNRYRTGQFPRSDRVKDLNQRYRWDLMWESGADKHLYDAGYKDAHIDTALKSIVPSLSAHPPLPLFNDRRPGRRSSTDPAGEVQRQSRSRSDRMKRKKV